MEAARRSDDRQNFLVGQRVFAKIKGYQAWPAMVTSVGTGSERGCKYSVLFYGTQQTGKVKGSQMWMYNKSNAEKFCTDRAKRRADFMKGLRQIEQEDDFLKNVDACKLKKVRVRLANSKAAILIWRGGFEGFTKMKKPLNLSKRNLSKKGKTDGWKVKSGKKEESKSWGNMSRTHGNNESEKYRKSVKSRATQHVKGIRAKTSPEEIQTDKVKSNNAAKKMPRNGYGEVYECRISSSAGESSDEEITFNSMIKRPWKHSWEGAERTVDDTDEEEEEISDQAGQLESQSAKELPYNVGRKKVLPCCSNCGNSLRGKVFMCQVGHKFCKTCLRKKKLESVDLILTCSAPCGMDIIGRDKGMEDYLDILLHCRKPLPVFSK